MIVTSRPASLTDPPVIVKAHMNKDTSDFPIPMVIYAEVSQGFLPVLGATVMATVEQETGSAVELRLLDDGSGADITKNDGIYSKYFTSFKGNGRYNLKVHIQGKDKTVRLGRRHSRALYVPGYIENADRYIIKMSESFLDLRNTFENATSVNTSSLVPKPAGTKETFQFKPENVTIENGTIIYFAIRAVDNASLISEVSNVVQAALFVPPKESLPDTLPTDVINDGVNVSIIVLIVTGSVIGVLIAT
ncbi:hypothetical protein KIL84_016081 [Mauremys mutica]|uniref:Uncharacterized protein n=1 Tax=Mauremys mutica TaxID=74926 RepID=A0A9D3WS13_9SAUR|nr:hypothetical protein KIL84_016081 [Mauremys mutica]